MTSIRTGLVRSVLTAAVVFSTVAFAAPASAAASDKPASPSPAALPAVNMEMVLLAAQVDPPKSDTRPTPGAKDDVLRVEQALEAKNLLASRYVDGHYGSSTVSAYAAWQRRLVYSGIDANGLPGHNSLTKLGENRFTVAYVVSASSRHDSYGGKRVDTRTRSMLAAADAKVAWSLTVTQGSYTSSNDASAGTHAGGGAVDVSVNGLDNDQRWQTVKALRTVGFAAWLRTPSQGHWPYHIHAIAVSDPDLSESARNQVHDYYFGKNGLKSHRPDDTPTNYRVGFTWWEKYRRS
jgi:hypothetical protein